MNNSMDTVEFCRCEKRSSILLKLGCNKMCFRFKNGRFGGTEISNEKLHGTIFPQIDRNVVLVLSQFSQVPEVFVQLEGPISRAQMNDTIVNFWSAEGIQISVDGIEMDHDIAFDHRGRLASGIVKHAGGGLLIDYEVEDEASR